MKLRMNGKEEAKMETEQQKDNIGTRGKAKKKKVSEIMHVIEHRKEESISMAQFTKEVVIGLRILFDAEVKRAAQDEITVELNTGDIFEMKVRKL